MKLPNNKKVYFASDNHLGLSSEIPSIKREKIFVSWLDEIRVNAAAIYLLGDLFDFWFEYKRVVPKGFVRILGKLAEISDSGIPISFFVGNHDLWMKDYFQKELGVNVHFKPINIKINNTNFFIGHGDGLGPGDFGYKRMKRFFNNPILKLIFRLVHPDIGIGIGKYLSQKNKLISGEKDFEFLGVEKEWLVKFCQKKLKEEHFDYFIFGHRHLPLKIELENGSYYLNLGDWITHFSYAVFDGDHVKLKYWLKD